MAAAAAEQLPRPTGPVLRLGSHNTCTISTPQAAEAAARSWQRAGLHVVLVQEHRLTVHTLPAVQRVLARLGWTLLYASSGQAQGGTAIVYRTQLATDGQLTIPGGSAAVRRGPAGRYIAAPFSWRGHDLHVASIYLPSGDPTAQRQYISTHLQPLAAAAAGRLLLWGGDFNFVPQPHLDRLHHAPGSPHPDVGTQQSWQEAMPDLVDVWRHRHPHRRTYTFIRATAASRIDRVYLSQTLLPYVATCAVQSRTTSDHRLVTLALTSRRPADIGPGRQRVRLGFASSPLLTDQLKAWLQQEAAAAPADPHAFLVWWPQFKRRLVLICGELHRASRRMSAAAEAAGAQLDALHAQLDAGDTSTLDAIVEARQRFVVAAAASEAEAALRRRQRWFHVGERPCPPLTRRLRPPAQSRQVSALRSASGQLLTQGTAMAQRVAGHCAAVSAAQPDISAAAKQEVLAALVAGRRLSDEQAALLGEQQVTAAEVRAAMRTAPPGRSPGHDGIPVELYRKFKVAMAPLLAALYTAIIVTGGLPHRFHEGLITIMHKAGDRTDPSNYRPITLLCTDYRIYAKLLALRLNPHLASIIDREQTAFVPGRRIGENVMALQCLSELLRRQGRGAIAVFCDFRKAYDTIDRDFLFSTMAALGVGPAFLAMVRCLLTATTARGYVNGFTSTPAPFAAGVRQGCPLAPLLYLFIAQALLRLLKARGVGIEVAGQRLAALQYADDLEGLLSSLDRLPGLLATLDTFGAASGQRLNPSKTRLLPIGVVPPGLPAVSHGLQVVNAATGLGITFGSAADPTASWPNLVSGVEERYARLADLPRSFSVFGRGFASAAYGVSRFLYHAEFSGHPPPQHLDRLTTITARIVDRRQAPADAARRFAGLASWLLPGRPVQGGFGALPWPEHITSRHAWWGLRLILEPDSTPWVAVARALLCTCAAEVGWHPLGLLHWRPATQPVPGRASQLPQPLHRLHTALASLPRVEDIDAQPLQPGPWCLEAPLWGNPFFTSPTHPDGLDSAFFDLAAAHIATLGQLLSTQRAVAEALHSAAAYHPVWATRLHSYASFADRHHAADRLQQLLAALPPAWVAAAQAAAADVAAGRLAPPSTQAALDVLLPRLGWRIPGRQQPLPLQEYTVRAGTALLTAPTEERRIQERLQPFAERLLGTLGELLQLLRCLWQIPWENCHKEPFWRLVYDAFPTAARMHLDQPCLCGGAPADLEHHFWACPVAAAVTTSISAAILEHRPAAAAAPITVSQLWLGRPPHGVHEGVWHVVCLAAIEAMDSGRRRMYAMSVAPNPHPPSIVATCGRHAVARFWSLLADFVALRRVPSRWRAHCPAPHPFVYFDAAADLFAVDRPVVAPATPPQ